MQNWYRFGTIYIHKSCYIIDTGRCMHSTFVFNAPWNAFIEHIYFKSGLMNVEVVVADTFLRSAFQRWNNRSWSFLQVNFNRFIVIFCSVNRIYLRNLPLILYHWSKCLLVSHSNGCFVSHATRKLFKCYEKRRILINDMKSTVKIN